MGERKYFLANKPEAARTNPMEPTSKGKQRLSPTSIAYLLNDIRLESNSNKNANSNTESSPSTALDSTSSTLRTQTSPSMPSRSYIETVTPFRYLSNTDNILLLTPYLHLPPLGHLSQIQMDPFQPFGKILCEYHSNIIHMPYVAKHGMLDSHERMIQESSAILVIVADSSASQTYHGERLDRVEDQAEFMLQAEEIAASLGKPCLVIEVGLGRNQEKCKSASLQVPNWLDLETATGMIFAR